MPKIGVLPHQLADVLVDVAERRRIAGAVGEENAVGLHARARPPADVLGGHHVHLEAFLPQAAEDVALHAEIVGDDAVPHRRELLEDLAVLVGHHARAVAFHDRPAAARASSSGSQSNGRGGRDFLHEIRCRPSAAPACARATACSRVISSVVRQPCIAPRDAQVLGERAGVDALDAGDAPLLQVVIERALASASCSRSGSAPRSRSRARAARSLSSSRSFTP